MEEYAWKQRRFFTFSHPRTMSNLLGRILESAPELDQCSYNFQDASMFITGLLKKWTLDEINDESWSKHIDLMEKGHASLQASILEAGQKKHHILIKNHAYQVCPARLAYCFDGGSKPGSNPTIFSDEEMLSWLPCFTIRHPISTFESWYRVESDSSLDLDSAGCRAFTNYKLSRVIFDWYRQAGIWPVVLDADDILEARQNSLLQKLSQILKIDERELRLEWSPTPANVSQDCSERHLRFMSGLWESTGVDNSKSSRSVDLSSKLKEWENTWGVKIAEQLGCRVKEAMPDYEYLMSMRLH